MMDPTIQTPVGPGIDTTGDIVVSLAEIDAMVRKAARGTGYAWGLAEEAGRAVRWLSVQGIHGAALIANLFDEVDGHVSEFVPDVSISPWTSKGDLLCPVTAGAALSDRAAWMSDAATVCLGDTMYPVILTPFLIWIARARGQAVRVAAGDTSATLLPDGPLDAGMGQLARVRSSTVSVAITASGGEAVEPAIRGVSVDVRDWRRLDRYASRTYVPTTEESRKSGAGAGTTDND